MFSQHVQNLCITSSMISSLLAQVALKMNMKHVKSHKTFKTHRTSRYTNKQSSHFSFSRCIIKNMVLHPKPPSQWPLPHVIHDQDPEHPLLKIMLHMYYLKKCGFDLYEEDNNALQALCVVTCCAFSSDFICPYTGPSFLRTCQEDVRWLQGVGCCWATSVVVPADGGQFVV